MNQLHFWHECIACGHHFTPDHFLYTCPDCGGLLLVMRDEDAVKRVVETGERAKGHFDGLRYGTARREYPNDSGVWLWRHFLLPGFPEDAIVSLKEGQTDLFEVPDWLGRDIGLDNLFIKMEGQAPSESFKDRGMPVAISDALRLQREYPELGIAGVSCASTGDTSAAAAVYSAYVRDRLSCVVLVPHEKIADAQLFQAMAHGADVRAVKHPDGFDGCMKLIAQFAAAHPEFVLVNSKNDMRIVGQESIGLEIIQDLKWRAPDWISIPVGNGGNLTALLSSLLRAKSFGLIDRLPGIIAGQTAAADTLVRWQESRHTAYKPHEFQDTVASAMNINDPVSFPRIKKLHDKFDLRFYRSSEAEITDTWARFMRGGANICPQGAVAVHAVLQARAQGIVKPSDTVVAISTASALKFTEAGVKYHQTDGPFANPYRVVEGSLAALEASL
ncbi:MAG: Threonine synthase [Patescibacteria group bacterium]|nr:Threonine synthase [Patescibacteria group bacterium]